MRNHLENAKKFLRLLTRRRSAYPEEIQIEVTNACNLNCAMCPHSFDNISQEDFPIELFENLVQNNPSPKHLVLTGWGEPLMHRRFFEMVELSQKYWSTAQIRFTTNGILLNQDNQRRIAEHQLAGITVSVDLWSEGKSTSDEWRDILHPPSPKALSNLIEYCSNDKLAEKTPLILQSLLVQENYDDVKQWIEFAAQHTVVSINLVRMQQYPGQALKRPEWKDEQQMIADMISFGKERGVEVRSVNQQNILLRLATNFDRTCLRTDDGVYITIDGSITPCCNLRDYSIGDLVNPDNAITTAWNSIQEQQFFTGQNSICGKCDALFHGYRE